MSRSPAILTADDIDFGSPSENSATNATRDFSLTDSGNAETFAEEYGDRVCFDYACREWFVFDGHRWVPNVTAEVDRLALATIRRRQVVAASLADDHRRKAALRWASLTAKRRLLTVRLKAAPRVPGNVGS